IAEKLELLERDRERLRAMKISAREKAQIHPWENYRCALVTMAQEVMNSQKGNVERRQNSAIATRRRLLQHPERYSPAHPSLPLPSHYRRRFAQMDRSAIFQSVAAGARSSCFGDLFPGLARPHFSAQRLHSLACHHRHSFLDRFHFRSRSLCADVAH